MNSKIFELVDKLELLKPTQRKEVKDFVDFMLYQNGKKSNKKKANVMMGDSPEKPFTMNNQKAGNERFNSKAAWELTKNYAGKSLSEMVIEERRENG
jgi:hypothetical protein